MTNDTETVILSCIIETMTLAMVLMLITLFFQINAMFLKMLFKNWIVDGSAPWNKISYDE